MKKFFAGFGLVLVALTVYAFSQISNVHNIGDKNVNGATEAEKRVTAEEFNSLINTVRGINVPDDRDDGHYIGLEMNQIIGVDLAIDGMLRINEETNSTACSEVGTIFYKNKHFWGCREIHKAPVRLDVDECNSVDAVCGTEHSNCEKGTLKEGSEAETSTAYTWDCLGVDGGADANCTELKPVNAVCGSTHYSCDAGDSVNDVADTSTEYKWHCNGVNGGKNAPVCSETKPEESYVCTPKDSDPANSELCKDDDKELKSNTGKTVVASCTDKTKCEYVCKNGYHLDKENCVADIAVYNSYACKEGSWLDGGVMSDKEVDECKEKGNEYNEKASYSSGDEVCSSVVPDNKNCGK